MAIEGRGTRGRMLGWRAAGMCQRLETQDDSGPEQRAERGQITDFLGEIRGIEDGQQSRTDSERRARLDCNYARRLPGTT